MKWQETIHFSSLLHRLSLKHISVINQLLWFIIAMLSLKSANPEFRVWFPRVFGALGVTLGY